MFVIKDNIISKSNSYKPRIFFNRFHFIIISIINSINLTLIFSVFYLISIILIVVKVLIFTVRGFKGPD
jgi:uncharacterized membrane protein YdbT with pleckstrin-like domain